MFMIFGNEKGKYILTKWLHITLNKIKNLLFIKITNLSIILYIKRIFRKFGYYRKFSKFFHFQNFI